MLVFLCLQAVVKFSALVFELVIPCSIPVMAAIFDFPVPFVSYSILAGRIGLLDLENNG